MNVFSAENLFAPAPSSVGRFVAPVREFELLDARECDEVRRAVYELRPNWTRRDRDLPFFTLGAASYLDAAGGRDLDYRRKANALNPLLQSRFGWLYANLREALSCAFERSFCFDDRLALPGFHIFLAHEEFASGGSFHFDLQYQHLDWSILGEIDPREQISMTLAIRLPAGGAGLMTWPFG